MVPIKGPGIGCLSIGSLEIVPGPEVGPLGSVGLGAYGSFHIWAAVKELDLSCHNREIYTK